MITDLTEIENFLPCKTPQRWVECAIKNQDVLLIDHANCEKKAASTALNLIYKYTDDFVLLNKMSRLAREEMRHFEQVIAIMQRRKIDYHYISASRYAAGLRSLVRSEEPYRLADILIIGAFIEARSCERFARIAPQLDDELCRFYQSLLKSEARHYRDYLNLAENLIGQEGLSERLSAIAVREQQLIQSPDTEFRFHSGPMATTEP
jgi:tRNA-(ms[2]io[6]A)-hydroxylase|tara:strand:- start:333 stop:953 length:621 start_codon:yes stop_codon:yes gene_type:complete